MTLSGPVFLISPDGMLGRAFAEALDRHNIPFAAASFPQIDITRVDSLKQAVPPDTRVVINCSAFTDVDGAENQTEAAMAVNRDGVRNLAELCKARDATLVHFSTDYVFSGHATSPYPVDAAQEPKNVYGSSKAAGERALWTSGCAHLLIRTSWLYAPWANNFVRTMARLGKTRDSLSVVDDQRGRPTSAPYLAGRTLALLAHNARGTFHVTDGGECTWFGFTREIMRQLQYACVVSPCTSAEFPRPAARPPYSVLDLQKTEALLGPSRPWRDNLRDTLAKLESI